MRSYFNLMHLQGKYQLLTTSLIIGKVNLSNSVMGFPLFGWIHTIISVRKRPLFVVTILFSSLAAEWFLKLLRALHTNILNLACKQIGSLCRSLEQGCDICVDRVSLLWTFMLHCSALYFPDQSQAVHHSNYIECIEVTQPWSCQCLEYCSQAILVPEQLQLAHQPRMVKGGPSHWGHLSLWWQSWIPKHAQTVNLLLQRVYLHPRHASDQFIAHRNHSPITIPSGPQLQKA